MITRIPVLFGLLVVQLLILALLFFSGGEENASMQMLDFNSSEVTALDIEDGEGNGVSLQKVDDQWRLGELPADEGRITDLIESLTGGTANWPVATSEGSQARFEVSEQSFQRRVSFAADSGELATLYLGSSPGFRRIHAREASSDAIFSIDFGVHELPADASDWLDKGLLRAKAISRVTFPDGPTLQRDENDDWTIDGQTADGEAADRYVGRIEDLQVLGLYEAGTEVVLGEPTAIELQDDEGAHRMTFRFNEAVDEYVLESDRMPGAFTLASYLVEQILIPAADLLPVVEEGVVEEDVAEEAIEEPAPTEG